MADAEQISFCNGCAMGCGPHVYMGDIAHTNDFSRDRQILAQFVAYRISGIRDARPGPDDYDLADTFLRLIELEASYIEDPRTRER